MLMRLLNPELYPRDWFFAGDAQYTIRTVFLNFEILLYRVIGSIPLLLFWQYIAYLAMLSVSFFFIARKLNGSVLLLFIWVIMAVATKNYADVAGNFAVEQFAIPRMYSYASCFIAIALVLHGWPFPAGLAMGMLGLFQAAPPLQFIPILIVWMIWSEPSQVGLKKVGFVLGGFLLTFWPQYFILGDLVSNRNMYSQEERIHLLAYIRHPHLMLPSSFDPDVFWQAGALLLIPAARWFTGHARKEEMPVLRLLAIMTGFFIVSLFMIMELKSAAFITFQPLRMFVIFQILVYLAIAFHIMDLMKHGRNLEVFRAISLAWAIPKADGLYSLVYYLLIIEAIQYLIKPVNTNKDHRNTVILAAMHPINWWLLGNSKSVGIAIFALFGIFYFWMPAAAKFRELSAAIGQRPAVLMGAGSAACAGFLAIMLLWPFQSWEEDPSEWSALTKFHYAFTCDFQVYPYPNESIERAAHWAKSNLEPDALVLIPPGPTHQSFHLWSERSAVFLFKTIPLEQRNWDEWLNRYFGTRGLLNYKDQEGTSEYERIYMDSGAKMANQDYGQLSAEQYAEVADYFEAGYILTPSVEPKESPHFEFLAGPFINLDSQVDEDRREYKYPVYMYQRISAGQTAAGG